MLELKNINYQIDINSRKILNNISLKIEKLDFLVILGSNGSGKSTLSKIITKEILPNSGKVLYQEKGLINIISQNPEDNLFYNLSVRENIKLWSKNKLFDFAEYIAEFNANLALKLDLKVEKLSGGEKQALILALMLIHPPLILILDEHTSALDPKSAKHLMLLTAKKIVKQNITCIMTTHNLEHAINYGNKLVALKDGKIIFQAEILAKSKITEAQLLKNCY